MTIKQLLGKDVSDLEKLSHEELLAYLQPYIIPAERMKKPRSSNVINTTEVLAAKASGKKETPEEFIVRMTKMMQQKMES